MIKLFTPFTKIASLCLVAITANVSSYAQNPLSGVNNYLKRKEAGKSVAIQHHSEIGYGFVFGNGTEVSYMRYRDQNNPNVITGTTTGKSFSYRGINAFFGTYFPITYLSNNTGLLLNTSLMINLNKYELGNTSLDPGVTMTNETSEALVGAPIGVDFAYGGEVTNNKIDKVTLRAGAGIMPYFNFGQMADNSSNFARVGVRPYVKAELGFFLGVEWKVRGMFIAGSRTLYDYTAGEYYANNSDYYGSYSLKLSPCYVVGFSVFPFSFGWDNDKW